ncbi:MAG: hypothetical protein JWN03_2597 [Nocardia sp.]|nr:hypothetical protein [Nocardia sp.]
MNSHTLLLMPVLILAAFGIGVWLGIRSTICERARRRADSKPATVLIHEREFDPHGGSYRRIVRYR